MLRGVLQGLQKDVEAGYLESLTQRIHANVFSDLLESAEHLALEDNNGYKDAAAVLAGGVLEQHIRKLCEHHNIPTEHTNNRGELVPTKIDSLNAQLVKVGAYNKTDQGAVTNWYRIRTDAAHARYDQYTTEQVRILIDGLRSFIARNPA